MNMFFLYVIFSVYGGVNLNLICDVIFIIPYDISIVLFEFKLILICDLHVT